jgi:phosphate-selective porin OprO/OprP
MSNFGRTALASVINLTLLGISDVYAADSDVLEKRIQELEGRLEKMDRLEKRLAKMDLLEKRLEKLDRLEALSAKSEPLPVAPQTVTVSPEIAKLKTKVNTLERKLELQEEVNTAAFKKLPIFDGGENGFKITSSDKKHQLRIGSSIQTDYRNFLGDNPPRLDSRFSWVVWWCWSGLYFFEAGTYHSRRLCV